MIVLSCTPYSSRSVILLLLLINTNLAHVNRSILLRLDTLHGAKSMTQHNQPQHNAPRNPSKCLLSIIKTILSILLAYLLSPPDISIHIHHINIMF